MKIKKCLFIKLWRFEQIYFVHFHLHNSEKTYCCLIHWLGCPSNSISSPRPVSKSIFLVINGIIPIQHRYVGLHPVNFSVLVICWRSSNVLFENSFRLLYALNILYLVRQTCTSFVLQKVGCCRPTRCLRGFCLTESSVCMEYIKVKYINHCNSEEKM